MNVAPDYQPYVAGPFRWRLALRPLDLSDWIQIGDDYDHEMDAKREVLREHHRTVVATIDGTEPEGAEVLGELAAHLCRTRPDWFTRDGDVIVNLHRGEHWPLAPAADGRWSLHPLDIAGRLVQEDLAMLVERDGRLVFGGGSVCFPNRWDLTSKLGRTMEEVHAPVDRLNDQLRDPIESFFARLSVDKPFWRLGWGVLDTDDPYQPMDGSASVPPALPTVGSPDTGERLFLRVERETLRRFASTNCVLFTIRTYIRPLSHLVERPVDAGRLADALSQLPDDVREYKRTTELTAAAVQWLNSVAARREESPGGR